MRGSSADSATRLSSHQASIIADGADASALADDLFAAVGVLRTQAALRRAATDPTTEPESRSALVGEVFAPHVGEAAKEILQSAAGTRWASSTDMVDTVERLGVIAVARAADNAGEGDRLETEMFSVGQLIADHPELRDALTDSSRSVADKQALMRDLLDGKATNGTVRLAEQALSSNFSTVRQAFVEFGRYATEARGRLVARVEVAQPLADADQERLGSVLAKQYGKPVHLDIVVDPELIGGIHVTLGDEQIDGTISSRLTEARRQLAG